jgi:hypothetical protein
VEAPKLARPRGGAELINELRYCAVHSRCGQMVMRPIGISGIYAPAGIAKARTVMISKIEALNPFVAVAAIRHRFGELQANAILP